MEDVEMPDANFLKHEGPSEELLLQLAAEDMSDLLEDYPVNDMSFDTKELAYKLYLDELRRAQQFTKDRNMALSMGGACVSDQAFVAQTVAEETQAIQDHQEACRLARQTPRRSVNPTAENVAGVPDADLARYSTLNVNTGENIFAESLHNLLNPLTNLDGPATRPHPMVQKESIQTIECVCCGQRKPAKRTVASGCGHQYCDSCLVTLFKHATVDESLYPPRCCRRPLPVEKVRPFMSFAFQSLFDEKSIEFTTPNRTYCANPQCSKFIKPQDVVQDVGFCGKCLRQTCMICKAASHVGECPEDPAVKQVLQIAEQEGWRQCYRCKRMIEILHGCNHMTAEFCYNCGLKWKGCRCDVMHEHRLYAEATERLRVRGEVANNEAIERAAQHIRDHHECLHLRARTVGPAQESHQDNCELCNASTYRYSQVCNQCDLSMCMTCYRHRR